MPNGKPLTIKQLIELLKQYPDDMAVFAETTGDTEESETPVLRVQSHQLAYGYQSKYGVVLKVYE